MPHSARLIAGRFRVTNIHAHILFHSPCRSPVLLVRMHSRSLVASLMTLLLTQEAQAHFNLNYPETVGFEDEAQHDGPCGGFMPDFSKDDVTDFYVGGGSIATLTTHTEGNWLYRITLDKSARGNWTQIFPIVRQTSLGAFCELAVTVPEVIGHTGVLGVVSNTPDGVL